MVVLLGICVCIETALFEIGMARIFFHFFDENGEIFAEFGLFTADLDVGFDFVFTDFLVTDSTLFHVILLVYVYIKSNFLKEYVCVYNP